MPGIEGGNGLVGKIRYCALGRYDRGCPAGVAGLLRYGPNQTQLAAHGADQGAFGGGVEIRPAHRCLSCHCRLDQNSCASFVRSPIVMLTLRQENELTNIRGPRDYSCLLLTLFACRLRPGMHQIPRQFCRLFANVRNCGDFPECGTGNGADGMDARRM